MIDHRLEAPKPDQGRQIGTEKTMLKQSGDICIPSSAEEQYEEEMHEQSDCSK